MISYLLALGIIGSIFIGVNYTFAQESPQVTEIMSPRMQVFSGVTPEDVVCKDNFKLIFKSTNGNPACVKLETAKKLLDDRWALKDPAGYQINYHVGWVASYCDTAGGRLFQPPVTWAGPVCDMPTLDAGKECSDSSQCESYCLAREGEEIGSSESGQCSGFHEFICIQLVRDGLVDPKLCK